MPLEGKYGRVTTERGTIGDDEPVFLFRAQDRLLPDVLRGYIELCEAAGSPTHHIDVIRRDIRVIEEWQATHFTQTPQSKGCE